MVLSASMMLRVGLNEFQAADDLERAVERVLEKGFRTIDISGQSPNSIGCDEMGEQIIKCLQEI